MWWWWWTGGIIIVIYVFVRILRSRSRQSPYRTLLLKSGIELPIQRWIRSGVCEGKSLILLAAYGTRGDIQPFLALAVALRKRGQNVLLCAPSCFHDLALDLSVPFCSIGVDVVAQPTDIFKAKGFSEMLPLLTVIYEKMARAIYTNTDSCAMIVCGGLTRSICLHIAEKRNIPCFCAHFAPTDVPTCELPPLEYLENPYLYYFPGWLIRALYTLRQLAIVISAVKCGLADADIRVRTELLGLPKLNPLVGAKDVEYQPSFHAYSMQLQNKPLDWPEHAMITGFWSVPPQEKSVLDNHVKSFLQSGNVAFVTFGSMQHVESLIKTVIQGIRNTGLRVLAQHSQIASFANDHDVLFWEKPMDYELLLSSCCLVVHHGGAGTTYACLKQGIPTIVIPLLLWADQNYWARRVQVKRCGVRLPFEQVSLSTVADRVREAQTLHANAQAVRANLEQNSESVVANILINYIQKLRSSV